MAGMGTTLVSKSTHRHLLGLIKTYTGINEEQ